METVFLDQIIITEATGTVKFRVPVPGTVKFLQFHLITECLVLITFNLYRITKS